MTSRRSLFRLMLGCLAALVGGKAMAKADGPTVNTPISHPKGNPRGVVDPDSGYVMFSPESNAWWRGRNAGVVAQMRTKVDPELLTISDVRHIVHAELTAGPLLDGEGDFLKGVRAGYDSAVQRINFRLDDIEIEGGPRSGHLSSTEREQLVEMVHKYRSAWLAHRRELACRMWDQGRILAGFEFDDDGRITIEPAG